MSVESSEVSSVLVDRIDVLRTGLQRLTALVATHGERSDEVGSVARALAGWFEQAVHERMTLLQPLQNRAEQTDNTADEERACWSDLLDQEAYFRPVAEQALDVLGGALLRSVGADGGMCGVTDRLLSQLAPRLFVTWDRATLPATGERLDVGSWVVRLRFPIGDLWSVPNAVHELGHYAIERFGDSKGRNRLQTFVQKGAPTLNEAQAKEVLADSLATLLIGPAMTASLIWRASPLPGAGEGDRHPTWDTRVRTSLRCLGLLVEDGRLTRDMVGRLEEEWRRLSARIGIDRVVVVELAFWPDLAGVLQAVVPPSSRFHGLDHALAVVAGVRRGEPIVCTDLMALLTAPWLVRLSGSAKQADDAARVATDAMLAAVKLAP